LPKAKPKGTIYDIKKVKATRSDAMVAPMLLLRQRGW
jgi:hypothetical protein